MGNEISTECHLGRRVEIVSPNSCAILYDGICPAGSPPLSVFVYSLQDDSNKIYVEHAAKFLKILRHPSILKFHSLILPTSKEAWLITERVIPLEIILDHLSPTEICSGLYNIIETLSFLHERGGFSHNNFSMQSVYVATDGTWKLGSLECVCSFNDSTPAFLQQRKKLRSDRIIPPEEKDEIQISVNNGHCRDVFAFGLFVQDILPYLSILGDTLKSFQSKIENMCLSVDPLQRPKIHMLLEDEIFRTDFVDISNFLKRITMKSVEEKKLFFSKLVARLLSLPEELVASRLARLLVSRFVILEPFACDCLLPHLLTPVPDEKRSCANIESGVNPILSESLFRRHLIPELYKIFHVRDVHIRCVLLTHFHRYLHLFDRDALANVIFPQILVSLRDADDELAALSLRAIADLVPVLGGDVIVGPNRLKHFAKGVPRFAVISDCDDTNIANGSATVLRPMSNGGGEVERQRRREESKRRVLERRKKREEENRRLADKTQAVSTTLNDGDQEARKDGNDFYDNSSNRGNCSDGSQSSSVSPRHIPSTSGSDTQAVEQEEDFVRFVEPTDSDIEFEIQEELKALEFNESMSSITNLAVDSVSRSGNTPINSHLAKTSPLHLNITNGGKNVHNALKLTDPRQQGGRWSNQSSSATALASSLSSSNSSTMLSGNSQTSIAPKSANCKDISNEDWGDTSWENFDDGNLNSFVASQTNKIRSPNSTAIKSASFSQIRLDTGSRRQQHNQPLGAEFDIMMIDIKTMPSRQSPEVDFFADMAPRIKPLNTGLLGILGSGVEDRNVSKSQTERSKINEGKNEGFSKFDISYKANTCEVNSWEAEESVIELDES